MGTGYFHHCSHCSFSLSTSGPWEFYRDEEGNRQAYGHPIPLSPEAEERGIWGYSAEIYCLQCMELQETILVEWGDPREEDFPLQEIPDTPPTCPICQSKKVIFEASRRELPCPQCKKGTLKGEVEWIS